MRIRIVCIGKTKAYYLIEGEKIYLDRLKHYAQVELLHLPDVKAIKGMSENEIKEKEGKQFMTQIEGGDRVFLLDERGKSYGSKDFSSFLQKQFNMGGKNLIFLIGGPYGFSDDLKQRADGKISLSDMTFSHEMIRVFFLEQIYRAFTILKGEPYHHE